MDVQRPRRYCGHCDNDISHTQYFNHRKCYFKNGVWEKKNKTTSDDALLSSHVKTEELEGNVTEVGEIDQGQMHIEDSGNDVMEEGHKEIRPATDSSDQEEATEDQSVHLFLDSSDSESVQDDKDIFHYDGYVNKEGESLAEEQREAYSHLKDEGHETSTTAGWCLAFNSPSAPIQGCEQAVAASPQTPEKLLNVISGLSRQLSQFADDVNQQLNQHFAAVNEKLVSLEARLVALESRESAEDTNPKKKRRIHNPKIAETVRRLHNSENNTSRYEPEQGLTSPHNQAVTSFLVGQTISTCPELTDVDKADIVSACKTYYETIRRNYRYSLPDRAPQAEAYKNSARSRSRRKRLLEARQSVLAADEAAVWKQATVDLMSDEEDGVVDGVSGWIVRPPPFRSHELTQLCATLQARLEADPKYRATHHRRLSYGRSSDRMPQCSSTAADLHYTDL